MRKLAIAIALATLFFIVGDATATPIIIDALRSVELSDFNHIPIFGPSSPSTAVGGFADSVNANLGDEDVSADQDSNIDAAAGVFAGSGSGIVGFSTNEFDEVNAISSYLVSFAITAPHSYVLTGNLGANVDGGQGLATFSLSSSSTSLSFEALDFETTSLNSSGVLDPGTYILSVLAHMGPGPIITPGSFMGGAATYNFNLLLEERDTPGAPEPATLALLALGLAGVGISRKRSS